MGIVLQGGPHDSSVARAWPTTRAFGGRGPYCWSANRRRAHASELAVRRPGKAPEEAVPNPSPGRHAATRSRRGSSSSSPPTADGGCSPWRPDAVMSTTRAWEALGPPDFQGPPGAHRTPRDDRLTHVQVPFTWNLSPLRPSKFSFEYLLLPPRSAPTAAPPGLTPKVSAQFGTVTRLPVHPASPVLLTKNGPLGALDSVARLNEAAAPSYLFKV
ncbi:hypothetical protein L6452_46504 [Arctium lappa]|nr:hypothetical protein L6452_46504 [Arctium lappa]